jgi:hypothetical protein
MPRAVAKAWVSKEGPWGRCRTTGPRAFLTGSAWDAAEITVACSTRGSVPGVPCWAGGVDGGSGGTDERVPVSCVGTAGGQGGGASASGTEFAASPAVRAGLTAAAAAAVSGEEGRLDMSNIEHWAAHGRCAAVGPLS